MISQDFIGLLLIVEADLRCGPTLFQFRAHFLDRKQGSELTIDTTFTWSLGDLRQSCLRNWLFSVNATLL
jgi:hypothetical protein